MKSLVLKDLYNIGHNVKSMLLVLVMFAVLFCREEDPFEYVVQILCICVIVCTMMIMTTFSFDDMSKWNRYALVMPVKKNQIVAAKFCSMLIFICSGVIAGLVLGGAGILVFQKTSLSMEIFKALLPMIFITGGIGLCYGSCMIPLVFQFGAEKARILTVVCVAGLAGVAYGGYKIIQFFGITITDEMIEKQYWIVLAAALLLCLVSYKISCVIFSRKEV